MLQNPRVKFFTTLPIGPAESPHIRLEGLESQLNLFLSSSRLEGREILSIGGPYGSIGPDSRTVMYTVSVVYREKTSS